MRSMPCLIGRRGTSRLVALLGAPDVALVPRRRDHVFALERAGGAAQQALVVRGARSTGCAGPRAARSVGADGRRHRSDRLVLPVARRSPRGLRAVRRRRRAQRAARARRGHRRAPARRDPRHAGGVGRLVPRQRRLSLHPLPGGLRVRPPGVRAPARRGLGRRPAGVGRAGHARGLGRRGGVARRPATPWCTCRLGGSAPTCTSTTAPRASGTSSWRASRSARRSGSTATGCSGSPTSTRLAAGWWPHLDDPARWETLVPEGEAVIDGVVPAGDALLRAARPHRVGRRPRRRSRRRQATGEVALDDRARSPASTPIRRRAWPSSSSSRSPGRRRCGASTARWRAAPWRSRRRAPLRPREAPAFTVTQTAYRRPTAPRWGCSSSTAPTSRPSPDTPAILTGYGGFAISSTPAWSPLAAAWCERGGLCAVAGLRGGLEEGEAWHEAGMLGQQAERVRRLRRRRRPPRRRPG